MESSFEFMERNGSLTPLSMTRPRDSRRRGLNGYGESHYLPKESSVHMDPASWYAGTADALSAREISWISTAAGVRFACDQRFKNKAFSIWRNSFKVINASGPRYGDFVRVADDIAFYNFFLRPAYQGLSVKVTALDEQFANEAFTMWCRELAPTIVVFLSALAHRSLRNRDVNTSVAVVPHPASQWWDKASSTYGGKPGRDALAECIAALQWPQVDSTTA
jgi:hypothetical protein